MIEVTDVVQVFNTQNVIDGERGVVTGLPIGGGELVIVKFDGDGRELYVSRSKCIATKSDKSQELIAFEQFADARKFDAVEKAVARAAWLTALKLQQNNE